MSADGTIAVVRSLPDLPREVWTVQIARTSPKWTRITTLNEHLLDLTSGVHEWVEWYAEDGQQMQGLLVRPSNARPGKRLPLIVHPHGGPTGITANEYMSPARWVYRLTQRGFAVFMPNYRGSTGRGIEFAEANIGDMGGRDFQDIMAGVDALIERGIADEEKLGIGGWSYGGFLTAWAITQTDRFKAAVAGAAITDWLSFHGTSYLCAWDSLHYQADPYVRGSVYERFSPMLYIANARTPTLILHGEKDGDVPLSQGVELFRALREHGVESEMVIYPREPHSVSETPHVRDLLQRTCDWFESHVL